MSQFELGAPERTVERRTHTLSVTPRVLWPLGSGIGLCVGLWSSWTPLPACSLLWFLSSEFRAYGEDRRGELGRGEDPTEQTFEHMAEPNRRSTNTRSTRGREGRGKRIQKDPQNPGQIPGQIPGRARRASKNETETETHTGTTTTILDRELGT